MEQDTLPLPEPVPRPSRGGDRAAHEVDAHALTDVGCVRDRNEDSFLVAGLRRSLLVEQTSLPTGDEALTLGTSQGIVLLVADGMGGHEAGDLASAVATDSMARYVTHVMPWLQQLDESNDEQILAALRRSLRECQNDLREVVRERRLRGMPGTTLTMAYVLWPTLYVVHAGDSRCYVARDGRLTQLTNDHTVAQELFARQAIGEEELRRSPLRHTLFNAVGGGRDEVMPELHRVTLEDGDTLLLCSDGLTGHLGDERINEVLRACDSSAAACHQLVEEAKADGGTDNITVVIARF